MISNLMKRFLFIPLLAVITLFSGFRPKGEWVKYTSAEGHFTIEFPGAPEESSQDDRTEEGVFVKTNIASYAASETEAYMAGWTDMRTSYPKNGDIKQMLENCRDGIAASMSAIKVTTIETNLGPNPYIEFTFYTEQVACKDRIYIINKYQYSLVTIFGIKTGIQPSADKFITSFKPVQGQ